MFRTPYAMSVHVVVKPGRHGHSALFRPVYPDSSRSPRAACHHRRCRKRRCPPHQETSKSVSVIKQCRADCGSGERTYHGDGGNRDGRLCDAMARTVSGPFPCAWISLPRSVTTYLTLHPRTDGFRSSEVELPRPAHRRLPMLSYIHDVEIQDNSGHCPLPRDQKDHLDLGPSRCTPRVDA